jgi:hypothetical protein
MSSTEKKPRLVSVNPIFSDTELTQRFQDAYTNQLPIDEKGLYTKIKFDFLLKSFLQGVRLEHEPFSYCIIDDFVADRNIDQFCTQLINELSNIKLNQKNNDLYKFQQVKYYFIFEIYFRFYLVG